MEDQSETQNETQNEAQKKAQNEAQKKTQNEAQKKTQNENQNETQNGLPDGCKNTSEESLTETVMERKENFDSDQSLCEHSRKLTSDSNILKKDMDNKSLSSAPQSTTLNPPPPRRLNKLRDHTSTVFPAGCMGCPEDPPSDQLLSPRRFLDAGEAREHAGLIDNTPKKRPSSAKPLPFFRNPLTGAGVDVEEVKKSTRRRGGNPLLGEGYDGDIKPNPSQSNSRIPPGGYSKGLW